MSYKLIPLNTNPTFYSYFVCIAVFFVVYKWITRFYFIYDNENLQGIFLYILSSRIIGVFCLWSFYEVKGSKEEEKEKKKQSNYV